MKQDTEDLADEMKTKKRVAKENEGDTEHPKAKDVADADEGDGGSGEEGVTVPEEFQKQAHALVSDAEKPHLSHLRDKISKREDELRDKEMKAKESKGGKGKGLSFDSSDMPVGDSY